jgi:hypothetical protein
MVGGMTDSREKRAPGWVPDLSTFGARLALLRQHMGWTNITEAAQLCGFPAETWRTWEQHGREPRGYMNVCMKIAGVTNVDLNWLAVGPQPVPTSAESGAVAFTKKWFGERVVATVGKKPDQAIDSAPPNWERRTRPINRHPSRQLVSQAGRY